MTNHVLAPAEAVDQHCKLYISQKAEIERLAGELDTIKATLILMVSTYGYVPTNAEKSKRLDGIEMLATVTTGSSVEVDGEAVTLLQLALSRAKLARVFSKLFARTVKYSLKKDASDTLNIAIQGLPEAKRSDLSFKFGGCFKVASKTPSLTVEAVSVVREKEAAKAAKAAKKKAKKGGK